MPYVNTKYQMLYITMPNAKCQMPNITMPNAKCQNADCHNLKFYHTIMQNAIVPLCQNAVWIGLVV